MRSVWKRFYGFGFQLEEKGKCLYIAQAFVREGETQKEMPESALALFEGVVKVWLTTWLIREWITIAMEDFNHVEYIFNKLLDNGYEILTHTTPKTMFKPGERFSRRELDLHMIATYEENVKMVSIYSKGTDREMFEHVRRFDKLRTLLKPENWATPEGLAFCELLRGYARKKKRFPKETRFGNQRFVDICTQHGILFKGGWYAYEPTVVNAAPIVAVVMEPHLKKQASEEDDDCLVCFERKATSLVLPCEHRVVCDECSKKLRATNDNKICLKCRCPITHVAYTDNELEIK